MFNFQKSGGKLAGGRVEINEDAGPAKKKRKVVSRVVRPTLADRFKGVDASSITKVWQTGNHLQIGWKKYYQWWIKNSLKRRERGGGGSYVFQ